LDSSTLAVLKETEMTDNSFPRIRQNLPKFIPWPYGTIGRAHADGPDPGTGRAIAACSLALARRRRSPAEALVRAIVYQSVLGKAAASIFAA
jgi:hypothetical protein